MYTASVTLTCCTNLFKSLSPVDKIEQKGRSQIHYDLLDATHLSKPSAFHSVILSNLIDT